MIAKHNDKGLTMVSLISLTSKYNTLLSKVIGDSYRALFEKVNRTSMSSKEQSSS